MRNAKQNTQKEGAEQKPQIKVSKRKSEKGLAQDVTKEIQY